ncbi:MAG: sigma-70 family RNA polymerase sigma factor [Rhodothermaceae bacterium]|nr:sigma-70 family RNA polymerase sigma factor [Rhodothermaceae bacterium]
MTTTTVTDLLHRLRNGDDEALEHLMPLLYEELHALAQRQRRDERTDHTLNTTALVNEAYLKLAQQREVRAEDRAQFFALAATTMRHLLVDYARARRSLKRGGGERPVPLDKVLPFLSDQQADEVLALDEALTRLEAANPRGSQVVQYRFFGGLTLEETGEAMGLSAKTVQRAWTAAQAWLRKEVARELNGSEGGHF